MKKRKKRVYLIGDVFGSYRARVLIELLGSSPDFVYSYSDPGYLTPNKLTVTRKALFKGARIVDRLYGLFKFVLADLIYVLPASSLHELEYLLVRTLSKTVIAEFYVSQYDTYVNDRKVVEPDTKKARKLLARDQKLIDVSTKIVFLNKAEQAYYLGIAGRRKEEKNIHIIPLSTNSKKKAKLPYINNDSDIITLCWWGTFIPLHGLEKIIGAAEILKTKNVSFKIYLFGSSEELSKHYEALVRKKQLDDCVFIDNNKHFSDRSLEFFLANHCDIAFGNFGDSYKAKTVIVNKIVEAASMGIPVISQKTTGLTEYFTDKESIIFAKSTPERLSEKILDVMSKKELLLSIAKQSYAVYKNNFSKESYLRQISKIISSI